MKSCISETALYFKIVRDKVSGLCATYLHDTLHARGLKWSQLTKVTEGRLRGKARECNNIQFGGVQVKKADFEFELLQTSYISKLKEVPKEGNYSAYRSLWAKLAWSANTRPDAYCSAVKIAQVAEEGFKENMLSLTKEMNKIVRHQKNISLTLRYPRLKNNWLSLQAYSDASFARNKDLLYPLGYFTFLKHGYTKCQLSFWTSYKAITVNHSVFGSEVKAFADAFSMAHVIKFGLQLITGSFMRLTTLTDSPSLFDILTKSFATTEKRLKMYLQNVQSSYE